MTATRRDKNLNAPAQKSYHTYGPPQGFPLQKEYLAAAAARRTRGANTATSRRSVLLAAPSGAPIAKPLTGTQRRALKRQQAGSAPVAAAPATALPANKPAVGIDLTAASDADIAPTTDDDPFLTTPVVVPTATAVSTPAAPSLPVVAPVSTAAPVVPSAPALPIIARTPAPVALPAPLLLLHNDSWGSAAASPMAQQTPTAAAIRTPTRLVVSISSHDMPSPAATPAPAASSLEAVSFAVSAAAPLAPLSSSAPVAAPTPCAPPGEAPSIVTAALAAGALAAGTVALAGGAFAIGAGIVACRGAGLAAERTATWVGGRKAAFDKLLGEAVMGPEGYARYQGWLAVL